MEMDVAKIIELNDIINCHVQPSAFITIAARKEISIPKIIPNIPPIVVMKIDSMRN